VLKERKNERGGGGEGKNYTADLLTFKPDNKAAVR